MQRRFALARREGAEGGGVEISVCVRVRVRVCVCQPLSRTDISVGASVSSLFCGLFVCLCRFCG